jgi:phage terminase small subunit
MAKARLKKKIKKITQNREDLFVREYLIDFNGAAAARRAGYASKNARQTAHELLTKPYIVDKINLEMRKRAEKLELSADFTLAKLRALANSNIKNVAQWAEGCLVVKDSAILTTEEAYGIESIQMKQTLQGPEIKIKMRQPSSALEMLGRHQGLFDVGDQSKPSEELNDAIKQLEEEGK